MPELIHVRLRARDRVVAQIGGITGTVTAAATSAGLNPVDVYTDEAGDVGGSVAPTVGGKVASAFSRARP